MGAIGRGGAADRDKLAESVRLPTISRQLLKGIWPSSPCLAGSQFQRRDDPSVGSKMLEPQFPWVQLTAVMATSGKWFHWARQPWNLALKSDILL